MDLRYKDDELLTAKQLRVIIDDYLRMTRKELADRMGISESHVFKVARGTRPATKSFARKVWQLVRSLKTAHSRTTCQGRRKQRSDQTTLGLARTCLKTTSRHRPVWRPRQHAGARQRSKCCACVRSVGKICGTTATTSSCVAMRRSDGEEAHGVLGH